MIDDQQGSPRRRKSLKGESIRSLQGHLKASISSSSLADLAHEQKPKDHKVKEKEKTEELEETEYLEETENSEDEALSTITTTKIAPATGRNANQVRSRLLQNLGIEKQREISPVPPNSSTSEPWGPTYEAALIENTNRPAPTSKLQFYPIVQVHPIPSYKVYSKRIQQTIWTNAYELREQVARNTLEFSYEQWDANQVLTEDNGLIFHQGEWIHPVHVDFVAEGEPQLSSEEELWILTCERLGIQPAAFYHSLPTITKQKQAA